MSSRRTITPLAAAGALLALAAPADAASAAKYPSIKTISPMQVQIGQTLTITGKGFVKGKGKTTVVFRRTGKRTVFAAANALSTTKLTVVVPEKLTAMLGKKNGAVVPSRFQIRILARQFGKTFTTLKTSPVIAPAAAGSGTTAGKAAAPTAPTPAATGTPSSPEPAPPAAPPVDTDRDGTPDATDPDDDNDLLSDATEGFIATDSLNPDSDGDGMEDGWEYTSAKDWNSPTCYSKTADYPEPCPGLDLDPTKQRYPNPLNPDDGGKDYDADYLSASLEHALWKLKWTKDPSYHAIVGPKAMWYSAGRKSSVEEVVFNGCRGLSVPTPIGGPGVEYRVYSLDRTGDHCLNDWERDEDGDYLSNGVEAGGELSGNKWWEANYKADKSYLRVDLAGTNPLLADTDNDGIIDGIDDQDQDGFWNVEEIHRGPAAADKDGDPVSWPVLDTSGNQVVSGGVPQVADARYGLWVQPFNPCLPAIEADKCPDWLEIDQTIWSPYVDEGADPPAPRWPLYDTPQGDLYGEVWEPVGSPTIVLPPADPTFVGPEVKHPLPRIY